MARHGTDRQLGRRDRRCAGTATANELQIEAMVGRLGDAGIAAIAQALQQVSEPSTAELVDNAGN